MLPLGQWISTKIVLPSGTISHCHVDVHRYDVAIWDRQSPWIHSSTQWIAYCPMKWCCHQVSVTAVSQIHALGECPLEWWCPQISAVPAMHRQFCAHNECRYNSVLIKNCQSPRHQFHTHWMFTKSPVSVVSPVLSTMNVHRITSLLSSHQFHTHWTSTESPLSVISPVSHTLNVHWITSLCCLTSLKHTECPLNHQPLVSHQSEAQRMFTESLVSHQFHAQWTSAGTVLLSESHVSLMSH